MNPVHESLILSSQIGILNEFFSENIFGTKFTRFYIFGNIFRKKKFKILAICKVLIFFRFQQANRNYVLAIAINRLNSGRFLNFFRPAGAIPRNCQNYRISTVQSIKSGNMVVIGKLVVEYAVGEIIQGFVHEAHGTESGPLPERIVLD